MPYSGLVVGIIATFVCCASANAMQRDVSTLHVSLDDWVLVPTLRGSQVETIAAFRDPALATGQNVTAVWFVRTDQTQWEVLAWEEQNNLRAVGHIKTHLGLDDSTDTKWPSVALIGVETDPEADPKKFALGVFEDDPYAPILNALTERGPLLSALTQSGWQSARIAIWSATTTCTRDEILSSLAARIEADEALNAGGTLVAGFTVPASDCNEYVSLGYPLDSNGQWLLPDFTSKLGDLTDVQPGDPWQANAPGTIFTGPQTVVMEVGGHDGATPYTSSHLVITLRDLTPPVVSYEILAGGQPGLDSPSGLKYFIAPADISLNWSANDNVDGALAPAQVDVEIDCAVVEELAPVHITNPGFYTLQARFRDAAGNTTTITEIFEVRSHYNYAAKSAVDSITITPNGQLDFVEANVLLTGTPTPVCEMAPSTIAVWLLDDQGEPIGDSPLRAAPDTVVNAAYNPNRIDFDLCVMRLAVQGYVPSGSLSGNTVRFEVTGSGSHGTAQEFDFISRRQPFVAEANARQSLSAFAPAPICNCNTPPGPPPCTWKSQLISDQPDTYSLWETGPCGGRAISMTAEATYMHGTASATDNCWYASVNASISHSVASGGTLKVFLEPQNCCTDCSISIVARPKFKAEATIDPPASASAGGYISVASPCGNANAQGGVAIGDYSTPYVEIFGIPIPVGQGNQSGTQVFQDNLSCVEHSCSVNVSISTGAYVAVNAHSTIKNWIAEARANVFGADVGLTVTPTAIPGCNVTNDGTPFEVRRCPVPVPLP